MASNALFKTLLCCVENLGLVSMTVSMINFSRVTNFFGMRVLSGKILKVTVVSVGWTTDI